MTNLLDNELVRKIEAVYEILMAKHPCMWGHGTQHVLCDPTCHCLCKPKPSPEPEKCDCGRVFWQEHGTTCSKFNPQKPKDEMEEKIREFSDFLWNNSQLKWTHNQIDDKLRELVELARKK